MNTEMMLKVADQISNVPQLFDYESYASDCGTSFCVAGWAMVLDGWAYDDARDEWIRGFDTICVGHTHRKAALILGLDNQTSKGLFFAEVFEEQYETTASEVAEYMRNMVKEYENAQVSSV